MLGELLLTQTIGEAKRVIATKAGIRTAAQELWLLQDIRPDAAELGDSETVGAVLAHTASSIELELALIHRLEEWTVLVDLREATGFDGWKEVRKWGWDSLETHQDPSQCCGVFVNESGKISELDLGFMDLCGSIPESIVQLQSLVHLDLQRNSLSGPLPHSIEQLQSLETLSLHENRLSGAIPAGITELSVLRELNLQWNDLSGPLPEGIGGCIALENMRLHQNRLTGSMPRSLARCTALQGVYLSANEFDGTRESRGADLKQLLPRWRTVLA
jgi:hypothetical protein